MPCDLGIAAEAHPIIVLGDVVDNALGKVPDYAFFAEYERTLHAAVDLAALAAPSAVQLAAVVAFVKFTAVVECVALLALQRPDNWMHANDVLLIGRRTDVLAA